MPTTTGLPNGGFTPASAQVFVSALGTDLAALPVALSSGYSLLALHFDVPVPVARAVPHALQPSVPAPLASLCESPSAMLA